MTNSLFAEHDSQFVLVNITTKRVIFCRSAQMVKSEVMLKLKDKWQIYKRIEEPYYNKDVDERSLNGCQHDLEHCDCG